MKSFNSIALNFVVVLVFLFGGEVKAGPEFQMLRTALNETEFGNSKNRVIEGDKVSRMKTEVSPSFRYDCGHDENYQGKGCGVVGLLIHSFLVNGKGIQFTPFDSEVENDRSYPDIFFLFENNRKTCSIEFLHKMTIVRSAGGYDLETFECINRSVLNHYNSIYFTDFRNISSLIFREVIYRRDGDVSFKSSKDRFENFLRGKFGTKK